MSYDPTLSIFAGMTTAQKQLALANAQQAYQDLSMGVKIASASYTQGDGAKSVSYTKAEMPALVAVIKQLQADLGVITRPRRATRFIFR